MEKIVVFTNFSPIFKGIALILLGVFGLWYALVLRNKWKEPINFSFKIFIALSLFILLLGVYILVLRPHWWVLPY